MNRTSHHSAQLLNQRTACGLLLGCVLLIGTGCRSTWRSPFGPPQPQSPVILVPGMALEQITSAVNQNAAKIQSLQTDNASLKVPGMPGVPALRGNIAAQRPGRIRVRGSLGLTGPEVDLGSNDELFWLWVRRNQPKATYYVRHDQFAGSSAQQMLPIDPQWLLDAMGFAQFKPTDHHEGPVVQPDGSLEIRSVINTRMGQLTKTSIVDGQRALLLKQYIYDAQGSILATTEAKSHRYYPELGISLPQKINIQMPAAELALNIDMGDVVINQVPGNPLLWEMPITEGYQLIDLGDSQGGVTSMGGQLSNGDWYAPTDPAQTANLPPMQITRPQASVTAGDSANGDTNRSPYATARNAKQFAQAPAYEPAATQTPPVNVAAPVQRLPAGGIPAR